MCQEDGGLMATTLSRRRARLYGLLLMLISLGVVAAGLAGGDLYVHARTQELTGVNVWGYRGKPVGRKHPGDVRVVMLGGSTAFGWGLPASESVPAFLERRLNTQANSPRRFSVVNLGAPGQGAHGFLVDLTDYASLNYDIVILYEGYNDLGTNEPAPDAAAASRADRGFCFGCSSKVPNDLEWRRQSPIFRLTGYFPMLPLVLREKAIALTHGGDVNQAYGTGDVVFRPGLATQATADALKLAAQAAERLEQQLGRLSDDPVVLSVDEQCGPPWNLYCGAVRDAVQWALDRDKRVIFVTQPYLSDKHVDQQAHVRAFLQAKFRGDARLQLLDLGHVINLRDHAIAYDGMHLVAQGNDTIASHLVEPVLSFAK